jgi:anti-sigma B factor antagonist
MAADPLPKPTLTLAIEKTPDETTVRCSGKITMETAGQLRDAARELIAQTKRLVLDLSDVSYLDSSGLGMIVSVYISARKAGCQLKLINLTPRVKEIFTLTRLEELLASTVHPGGEGVDQFRG